MARNFKSEIMKYVEEFLTTILVIRSCKKTNLDSGNLGALHYMNSLYLEIKRLKNSAVDQIENQRNSWD